MDITLDESNTPNQNQAENLLSVSCDTTSPNRPTPFSNKYKTKLRFDSPNQQVLYLKNLLRNLDTISNRICQNYRTAAEYNRQTNKCSHSLNTLPALKISRSVTQSHNNDSREYYRSMNAKMIKQKSLAYVGSSKTISINKSPTYQSKYIPTLHLKKSRSKVNTSNAYFRKKKQELLQYFKLSCAN